MSEKEFKAKERTVQKMSRDGLLEENLSSGTSKRVSQRVRQDVSMKEGGISSDAGIFRHSEETPDGRRQLYAEGDTGGREQAASPENAGRRQKQRKVSERSITDRSITGERHGRDGDSPEGGDFDAERSSKEAGYGRKNGQASLMKKQKVKGQGNAGSRKKRYPRKIPGVKEPRKKKI